VAIGWTGPWPPDGIRVADFLMSVLLDDLRTARPERAPWVFAQVHRDNARSLRMFQRMGFEVVEIAARSAEYTTVGARV